MKAVASDMALFFRPAREKISGVLTSYVDDTLACGGNTFLKLTRKPLEKFGMKARQSKDLRFSGVYIEKCDNRFEIILCACIERLKLTLLDPDYVQLRRARAKLYSLAH